MNPSLSMPIERAVQIIKRTDKPHIFRRHIYGEGMRWCFWESGRGSLNDWKRNYDYVKRLNGEAA